MANFDLVAKKIIEIEGEFSNHIADKGGKTKYGVTEATLKRCYRRKIVSHDVIENLTKEEAATIFKFDYWDVMDLDILKDQDIAEELFECGVNCGPGQAVIFLQRVLRMFEPTLTVDGVMGPRTAAVLDANLKKWRVEIYNLLNCQQAVYYMTICTNDKTQLAFLKGWLKNRINVKQGG